MRRAFALLVLVAIVAGIGWWLLHWRTDRGPITDPWKALPPDAAVILEVPVPLTAWQGFTSTSQFWADMERLPSCAALDLLLGRMADLTDSSADLRSALTDHPMVLAWEPQGGSAGMLAVWPVGNARAALAALGPALGIDLGAGSALWHDGRATLRGDSAMPALQVAWRNGAFLVSDDPAMLDQALERLAHAPAPTDTLLARARATLGGGSDAHLLVQPARAARMLAPWVGREAIDLPEGWAALDVRSRPGACLMSGLLFTSPNDHALRTIAHQGIGKQGILRVLPANVGRLRTAHVDDAFAYAQDMTGAAPDTGLFAAYGSWVKGTIGVAETRAPGDSLTHRWAVLQANDPGQAADALNSRCTEGRCDTVTYRGLRVSHLADDEALSRVFGNGFADFPRPYWTLMADKVVLANTPADMRAVIDTWTDGTSLAVTPLSGEFFRQYASEAGQSWWIDVGGAYPLWREQARPEAIAAMDRLASVWKNMGGCLLELSPQSGGVQEITFCLQHAPTMQKDAGALWSAAIGAPLEAAPFLVKDHLSKTLQLLVQDRDHRISLISCTGKVLWQRELKGPILGEVRQVDRFKNGKLQLLFNTANDLFLIDRNGKDVEGFPLRLSAPASAGLNVFDYDGTREYRALVPLTDGRVLNFGMDGKAVQGWAPPASPAAAAAPVEHVRLKDKDYLVIALVNGGTTVMDRRGETRYTSRLRMERMRSFLGLRAGAEIGACQLAWSDSSGAVMSGTLDGAVDTLLRSGRGSVTALDPDGNGEWEAARATSDSLTVTDRKGFRSGTTLPDGNGTLVFPVPLGKAGDALGVLLPAQAQARLYRSDGTIWPGLPLPGSVRFRVADINLDGVLELVTATDDGRVIVYALPNVSPP